MPYSGPVLEQVLQENKAYESDPEVRAYKGVPVVVSPIRDANGDAIVAIGIVDITGIFDLATLMEHQSLILEQVCGKDPCPLPGEQIIGKKVMMMYDAAFKVLEVLEGERVRYPEHISAADWGYRVQRSGSM